jgi:hypothetical protein
VLALGCREEASLEVTNTSGLRQQIVVASDSDFYLVDSLATGESTCWKVPEHVRNRSAHLFVGVTRPAQEASALPDVQPWSDSISLDRSWLVQIRVPRFVEGTPDWHARRREKEIKVEQWFRHAIAVGVIPPAQLMQLRDDMLKDSTTRAPDAPHLSPTVVAQKQRGCGRTENASG